MRKPARYFILLCLFGVLGTTHSQTIVPAGEVTELLWTEAGSPYLVEGSITVKPNATLIIQPGVEVRMEENASLTTFFGRGLLAEGTPEKPITFTSSKEMPAPGDWNGIFLRDADNTVRLKHCIIEYATNGVQCRAFASGCDDRINAALIENCTIRFNSQNGIICHASGSDPICIPFPQNGNSKPDILHNKIYNNGTHGILLEAIDGGQFSNGVVSGNIKYNEIFQNGENGIHAIGDDRVLTNIGYNTIINNGVAGIYFTDVIRTSSFTVKGNIVADNQIGLLAVHDSIPSGGFNDVFNNTIAYQGMTALPNDIAADPLFVDAANLNFQLTCNSPCIDAGDPMDDPDPDGSVPDIGAHPYFKIFEADIQPAVASGIAPLDVAFSSNTNVEANLTVDEYNWDFGDNTISNDPNPEHTFETAGNYQVCLTITNAGCGFTHQSCQTIIVENGNSCENGPNLSINTEDADCNQANGNAGINITGGTAPYHLSLDGTLLTTLSDEGSYLVEDRSAGNFQILVEDAEGCTDMVAVEINTKTNIPDLDFSVQMDGLGLSLSASANSTLTDWNWSFGDGASGVGESVVHTYANAGNYEVCLTASNECDISDMVCQTLSLELGSAPVVTLLLPDTIGNKGETLLIPLIAQGIDQIITLQGGFSVLDNAIAAITGYQPGAIDPNFNAGNGSFSYFDGSGTGVPLADPDTLFFLEVSLTGEPGTSTELIFSDEILSLELGVVINEQPQVVTATTEGGLIQINDLFNILGRIVDWQEQAVKDALVELQIAGENSPLTYTTGLDGTYAFSELAFLSDINLKVNKDVGPKNGVTTFPLFLLQQHLLGYNVPEIYTPYQLIAGDANCDGQLSSMDLLLIQRMIIGLDATLKNCPSWVFVPAEHDFPGMAIEDVFPFPMVATVEGLAADETIDFIGIKKGDILGQANPQKALMTNKRSNPLVLHIDHHQISRKGELVQLDLEVSDFRNLAALQMALQFDATALEWQAVEATTLQAAGSFAGNLEAAPRGLIRMNWFRSNKPTKKSAETNQLLSLTFKALKDIKDLSQLLWIAESDLPAEAFFSNHEVGGIQLDFGEQPHPLTEQAAWKVYPNPAREVITVELNGMQTSNAILQIFNELGQEVLRRSSIRAETGQKIIIRVAHLPPGIYNFLLRSNEGQLRKRLVIQR